MTESLEIGDDIYQFLDNIPLEKDKIKELIEYVHYKALLDLFTFFIEKNTDNNIDFLLTDYVEVISKIQIIINKIKENYDNEK